MIPEHPPAGLDRLGPPGAGRPGADYALAQAALVASLTGIGVAPAGFDPVRLEVARKALLRKRSGEIARLWPATRAALGERFGTEFAIWARRRPTAGSWRDGWDFLSHLESRSLLPPAAACELAERRLVWAPDANGEPRRRRLPRVARIGGRLLVQTGGRVRVLGR